MGKLDLGLKLPETKHKGKYDYFIQHIPQKFIVKGISHAQNAILFECLVPRTVEEIANELKIHHNTVRNNIKFLLDNQLLREYDSKEGRRLQYVRSNMAPVDSSTGATVEFNAPMFFYGDQFSGTLIDYIAAFSDEDTRLAGTFRRISGLLAHVWMRSFNARMGYHKRNIEPDIKVTFEQFNHEISKVEDLLTLLTQIRNSTIWLQESPSKNSIPLLDTDPKFIRLFATLQQEWVEFYRAEMEIEDDY